MEIGSHEPVRRYKAFRPVAKHGGGVSYQSALTGTCFEPGIVYERPAVERRIWPGVKIHKSGYHACVTPHQCFWGGYGYIASLDTLCEVELFGQRDEDPLGYAECAEMFRIVRVFTDDEKMAMISTAAVTMSRDGTLRYLKDRFLHRDEDLPAVIWASGEVEYWVNGKRHRGNGKPAIVQRGRREWWVNGDRHRDLDLAAIEDDNMGQYEWFVFGERKRVRASDPTVLCQKQTKTTV